MDGSDAETNGDEALAAAGVELSRCWCYRTEQQDRARSSTEHPRVPTGQHHSEGARPAPVDSGDREAVLGEADCCLVLDLRCPQTGRLSSGMLTAASSGTSAVLRQGGCPQGG